MEESSSFNVKVIFGSSQLQLSLPNAQITVQEFQSIIIDQLKVQGGEIPQQGVAYSLFDHEDFELGQDQLCSNILKPQETVILKAQNNIIGNSKEQKKNSEEKAGSKSSENKEQKKENIQEPQPVPVPQQEPENVPVYNFQKKKDLNLQQQDFFLVPPLKFEAKNLEQYQLEESEIVFFIQFPQFVNPNQQYPFVIRKNDQVEQLQSIIKMVFGLQKKELRTLFYNSKGISCLPISSYIESQIIDIFTNKESYYCIFTEGAPALMPVPNLDPKKGQNSIFVQIDQLQTILCDLETDTVLNLKQKLATIVQMPPQHLKVVYASKILKDENYLKDYNIMTNSSLTAYISTHLERDSIDLQGVTIHHIKTVSTEGLQILRSHLYILNQKLNSTDMLKLTALLRDLSNNNAPMIAALKLFFDHKRMTMAMLVALEEGLYTTLARLVFAADGEITFPGDLNSINIFEYSRAFLSQLVNFVVSLNNVPNEWRERENYFVYDKYCSVTFKEILKPVYLTKDDKSKIVCDHEQLLQHVVQLKPIPGIQKFSEKQVFSDGQLTEIHNFARKYKIADGILIWKPKHANFEKCSISNQCQLEENWYNTYLSVWEENNDFKIYHPSILQSQSRPPALTLQNGVELLIYTEIESCGSGMQILDIISGEEQICQNYDIDDTIQKPVYDVDDSVKPPNFDNQYLWDEQKTQMLPPIITIDPVQAIVVLFDTSGSMSSSMYGQPGLNRIGAVKSFFSAFADRTMAYSFRHVVSLITFQSTVDVLTEFTEMFVQFKSLLGLANYGGQTRLFDSLLQATDLLVDIQKKFPQTIPRIIALTDGEDTQSDSKMTEVAKKIIQHDIILDSFVVGQECSQLKAITFASGGQCFFPQSLAEGISLFEIETILCAGIREREISNQLNVNLPDQIFEANMAELKAKPFSVEVPKMLLPINIKEQVSQPSELTNNPTFAGSSSTLKRIMKELMILEKEPHQYIRLYPSEKDFTFWKVLIAGPIETPYEGGVFTLYIQFPENYPTHAPKIRFLTEIHHCNVNSQGRICHSVLGDNYSQDTSVQKILDCLFGLLLSPEPDIPLDSTLAAECKDNLDLYLQKAQEKTKLKAMRDIQIIVNDIFGEGSDLSGPQAKELILWIQRVNQLK